MVRALPNCVRILGRLGDDAPVDGETAREALGDPVALWEVRTTFGPEEVIAAATAALVAGVDSPTLRETRGSFCQG